MTTAEYFQKRALHKEQRQKNRGEKFLKNLEKTYKEAQKQIDKNLEKFYERYEVEAGGEAKDLNRLLSPKEVEEFYQNFDDNISTRDWTDQELQDLQKRYLKERISRLEALKKQIELQVELISKSTDVQMFEHLNEVYKDSYYDTAHQLYHNETIVNQLVSSSAISPFNDFMTLSFATLNAAAVELAVSRPWSGKSFSSRIWRNNKKTIREVSQALSVGFAQGHSIDKMSRRLRDRMNVSFSNAKRLVRTESNYVMGEATFDCYQNAGLEMYEFLATLDYRTSEICQELDGKRFPVKDRKVGVNCNPMHPNCRSTTVPYFPEDEEPFYRIARGSDGKNYFVKDNIDYKQWFDNLSVEEQTKLSVMEKLDRNKFADKNQYKRYKDIVGKKELPKTFDEFQEMKYNNPKEFELLRRYNKSRKKNTISAWSSFSDYKTYYYKVERGLVGLTTKDGVQITGQKTHFLERVLGTSHDPVTKRPRNGVEIEHIKDALLNANVVKSKSDTSVTEYRGAKAKVIVNHETGKLISVTPQ
ncbi:minor capsid protein [Filifactor villosus]|uniref:Minor capsid protein n=1 Tax=Filifactor villosus TaxID=29374 RepID=A0ABV9QNC2_9FIRM